jgi:hypothetical protein
MALSYVKGLVGVYQENPEVPRNVVNLIDKISRYEKLLNDIENDDNLNVDIEYFRSKHNLNK